MMQSNPSRSRERRQNPNPRWQNPNPNPNFQAQGPNWVLITGGVLLSTLTVHLGCKLKQVFDKKRQNVPLKGNKNNIGYERKQGTCEMHSNHHCFNLDSERCYFCASGTEPDTNPKPSQKNPFTKQTSPQNSPLLPLVKVNGTEKPGIQITEKPGIQIPNPESGIMWSASPDRLAPPVIKNYSNSSGSPCFSESGSDIYSKREVIQKLRLQLKRRDEMVLEMQAQIGDLQNRVGFEIEKNEGLECKIEGLSRDLFESEREIRRGKEIERRVERKVEGFKREIEELKEVIEGKDFLIQSYKEQKNELKEKVKELEVKLAGLNLPNIL